MNVLGRRRQGLSNSAGQRAARASTALYDRPDDAGRKKVIDEATVFDGHANHPTIEGPKLYKRNSYYYIFAPAGGVANGWQTVLRSKNVYGPYEDRIVLDKGRTEINGPHQGAWVDLKSGESWFIHFQDRGAYGRTLTAAISGSANGPVIELMRMATAKASGPEKSQADVGRVIHCCRRLARG